MLFSKRHIEYAELKKLLDKSFQIEAVSRGTTQIVFYDTADGLLFNSGAALFKGDLNYTFTHKQKKIEYKTHKKENLRFARDFKEPRINKNLKTLIKVRALIPLLTAAENNAWYNIRNQDKKIICRLNVISLKDTDTSGQADWLLLFSLRGYEEETKEIEQLFSKICKPVDSEKIYAEAFEYFEINKKFMQLKPGIKLNGTRPAEPEVRRLFGEWLRVILVNKPFISEDIDTEFLHNFRVNLRRTRSILSLLSGVIGKDNIRTYKNVLASIFRETNHMRDLDVYLLAENSYYALLPAELKNDLKPFSTQLKRERSRELKRIQRYLSSPEFHGKIDLWKQFLTPNENNPWGPEAGFPLRKVISSIISKRFIKIMKLGKDINISTPVKKIHRLRIESKKLRYIIEGFRDLYPEKEMNRLIRNFKKMQDNLGQFNDYAIQAEFVLDVIRHHKKKKTIPIPGYLAALGSLTGTLNQLSYNTRTQIEGDFKTFNSKENIQSFNNLFGDE